MSISLPPEHFSFYGSGGAGDKFTAIARNAEAILNAGFSLPHCSIIGTDVIDRILEQNGIDVKGITDDYGVEEAERKFARPTLPADTRAMLAEIANHYQGNFGVAVRSSAMGDAAGTGIYKSSFCKSDIKSLENAFLSVISGYFSLDAIEYRKKAKLPLGFAIGISPIIGEDIKDGDETIGVAPVFSGYGCTNNNGQPFMMMTYGLGKKLMNNGSRYGILLTPEREGGNVIYPNFCPPEFFDGRRITEAEHLREDYDNRIDLDCLFALMRRLEDNVGKPQYFEWALRREGSEVIPYLLQIADVDTGLPLEVINTIRQTDPNDKATIFEANTEIVGNGDYAITKIFYLKDADRFHSEEGLRALEKFNQENSTGYCLVVGGEGITIGVPLAFSQYSNASVILGIHLKENHHSRSFSSHFEGALRGSGKIMASLEVEYDQDRRTNLKDVEGFVGKLDKMAANNRYASVINVADLGYGSSLRFMGSERAGRFIVQRPSQHMAPEEKLQNQQQSKL